MWWLNNPIASIHSHPRGRPRLRQALANSYGPLFGRELDPESEIIVTAGANEGTVLDTRNAQPLYDCSNMSLAL